MEEEGPFPWGVCCLQEPRGKGWYLMWFFTLNFHRAPVGPPVHSHLPRCPFPFHILPILSRWVNGCVYTKLSVFYKKGGEVNSIKALIFILFFP